jgi:hypothetical protein
VAASRVLGPNFAIGMLSVPQPQASASEDSDDPVVNITENAATMCPILSLIYPMPVDDDAFKTSDLARLARLLEVSIKYDIQVAINKFSSILSEQVCKSQQEDEILRIYAVGCVLRIEKIRAAGLRACLKFSRNLLSKSHQLIPNNTFIRQLDALESEQEEKIALNRILEQFNTKDYFKLLQHHDDKTEVVKNFIQAVPLIGQCPNCGSPDYPKSVARAFSWTVDTRGPDIDRLFSLDNISSITPFSCGGCRNRPEGLRNNYLSYIRELERHFQFCGIRLGGEAQVVFPPALPPVIAMADMDEDEEEEEEGGGEEE